LYKKHHKFYFSFKATAFSFVMLFLYSGLIQASEYSPPGLYEVEHLTLENGMDVILKHRQGAHTFSMRLWVGVGTQDFACERQETPHFLEHLLFTGTSQHTEAELEHLVADHGGSWNAYTGDEETVYLMDIYSKHAGFAIDTLYEILTDSIISEEDVETSRDIIHREAGGKPSQIRKWFRLRGFGVNATEKAVKQLLPGSNFICDGFVTAEGISREDILDTFNKYYVPGNMALILVGDFDKKDMLSRLQQTFGAIVASELPERIEPVADQASSYESVSGTLSPMLGDDASVGVMYRVPGYWSDDNYSLMVIEDYLYFKINEIIRIERGLSYAPGVWSYSSSHFGLFGVNADVNLEDMDEAVRLIKKEMNKLIEVPMDVELLKKTKLKILLQSVQGYESNTDFADYYASQYVLFRKDRFFEDAEEKIEAVSVDDIKKAVNNYLVEGKSVTLYEAPTLSYTQFYTAILVLLAGLLIGILVLYKKVQGPK
jgi:predicted Zn-dependent peptidase